MKKKYWYVAQRYFDNGKVKIMVGDVDLNVEEKPKSFSIFEKTYDHYQDYFETREEAVEFAEQVASFGVWVPM